MKNPFALGELAQFKGVEERYRHAISDNVLFSNGVMYLADRTGAYWLLDEIALIQLFDERVSAEAFQVWRLKVNADCTGQFGCEDGNGNAVYMRALPFTDFPGEGIILWFTDNTILLPSEYSSYARLKKGCSRETSRRWPSRLPILSVLTTGAP
jgi:hypothetical protein